MESTEVQIARLQVQFGSVEQALKALVDEMQRAAEGRKSVYQKLEGVEREIIHIHHRLDLVERNVDSIRPTTAELERVRDRVLFAGKLGQALWSTGKALLSAAAGAAAAWYAMTGRPPP